MITLGVHMFICLSPYLLGLIKCLIRFDLKLTPQDHSLSLSSSSGVYQSDLSLPFH
ncbi:hypothetical protein HOR70_gp01 [Pectobacterium phage PPWS4]|uniref:Uncharacterized protein n=1 Tax=Pectobacterium phage PPWS4 TaxID=1961914 RepID=A0A286P061_9CAUD|nr:hypothetical protein HOR70_gp01 [Pectobacterium phage PPWS4]BBA26416.1 hypothetical protein [Pectobacterium phage PPWS4]